MHILCLKEISLEHHLESGYSFIIVNDTISLSKDNEAARKRRRGVFYIR